MSTKVSDCQECYTLRCSYWMPGRKLNVLHFRDSPETCTHTTVPGKSSLDPGKELQGRKCEG